MEVQHDKVFACVAHGRLRGFDLIEVFDRQIDCLGRIAPSLQNPVLAYQMNRRQSTSSVRQLDQRIRLYRSSRDERSRLSSMHGPRTCGARDWAWKHCVSML